MVILRLLLLLALAGTPFIGAGTALADTAPAFTSSAVAGFSVASGGSFTIAVDGTPAPVLAIVSGVLPPGLGFSDNHDGTATLSGTPAAGSGGSYPLAVSATNSAGTAVQHLSLAVGGVWVTTRAPSDLRYNGEPYDVSYNGNTRQLFPTQGTLNGLVNPNNDTCTVSFDYGPTTAYGSTLVYGDVSGAAPVAVSAHAYFSWIHDYFYDPVLHYRTKAVCATSGTWHGNDITFVPFTSTVRWYTDLGGPGPANASYPTLSIHVFATCLDDPTWANFDILNSSGLDVTVAYGPGTYDRVIIGDWQTQQVFFAKGSIPAFSYNYTLFNQTVTNDQFCAETPSPSVKIRAYALGLADTLAASGAQVFAIYNDNPAPVTLEVMAVADVFNVTLPAQSRQLIATGMGEMQLSHDATPFQVISPHSIFWADRYLVTAQPVCTTATTNAFMLNNNGAAPQTAVLRSGSTEHRHDLAAYESRQVTVESGSWDLYLVVPGMAGPRMVGDHLKVATLVGGGSTCGRTLTVEGNLAGSGYVTAAGCTLAWNGSSGSCSVADGASITLSSHPGSNGTFLGWSAGLGAAAACSGSADCTFTMNGDARLGWTIGDTTPDAYTFTAQNNAARSTVTTSNAITVTGIDSAAAISISGGEYSVSTDGGTNWSDWSTATPATVSLNHQVKVRLTSSANYSSAATATLTIGGVNGAFSVTTEAAPAPEPSYDPPPPPTSLTISANGSGTLTSSITQATVHGGATLIIPTTLAAAGVTLNLPTPATGSASPVTLTVNGQSLNVTPGAAGTVLRISSATVTLNGVPTVVQLVSLSAGSITVSGSGQTLLSIGSGTPPRLIASGGNEAVTALATLDAASGDTLLAVSGGMVLLPALNTATRSAAAQETEIHAGETVTFDSAGQLKSHRVAGGNGAGDPLTLTNRPAALTLDAAIPNLKGSLARLGGQSPEQAALALLGTDFVLGNGGQTEAGVLPLTVGQSTLHLLPLGPLDIDASQPDGVSLTADGLYQFARNGLLMRFAPSVRDSRQFSGDLAATFNGATASLHGDGVIVVRVSGVDFVMQPDLSAESGSGNAMGFDFGGEGHLRYRDAQGYRQALHPAFADLATLRATLTAAIPGIIVRRDNGAATAAIGEVIYTLVPDYTLTSIPAEQAGRSWWNGADGKLYIRNADGTAQGFAVR